MKQYGQRECTGMPIPPNDAYAILKEQKGLNKEIVELMKELVV